MADTQGTQRTRGISRQDGVELKEYLEKQLDGQRAYFESRIIALEKATEVAAKVLGERLAGMNEFREAMNDLSSRMVTRSEMTIQLDKIGMQVDDLKKSRDQQEGKASQQSVTLATLLAAAGLVIGVISLLLKVM